MILFESKLKSTIDERVFMVTETELNNKLDYQIDYPTLWHSAVGDIKDWDGTIEQQKEYRIEAYKWLENQIDDRIEKLTEFKKALEEKMKEKADKQLTLGLTGT